MISLSLQNEAIATMTMNALRVPTNDVSLRCRVAIAVAISTVSGSFCFAGVPTCAMIFLVIRTSGSRVGDVVCAKRY